MYTIKIITKVELFKQEKQIYFFNVLYKYTVAEMFNGRIEIIMLYTRDTHNM